MDFQLVALHIGQVGSAPLTMIPYPHASHRNSLEIARGEETVTDFP
jgi:hypothetical protein